MAMGAVGSVGSVGYSLGGLVWTISKAPFQIVSAVTGIGAPSTSALAALEMEKESHFNKKIAEMDDEDFSDLEDLKLIEISGRDRCAHPVVWITGRHLPAVGCDLERIKWFIFCKLHAVAEEDFVVVYTHTDASWEENAPGILWIRSSYEEVPAKYKANMQSFYVVHPGFYLRTLMWALGPFASDGFWRKLVYISRIEFLWDFIERSQCLFHDFVIDHDKDLETQPLMDYGIYSDPTNTPREFGSYLPTDYSQDSRYSTGGVRGEEDK